jgi:nitroreductase
MTTLLAPDQLNRPAPATLDLLLSRRSSSPKAMTGPGPDEAQLSTILRAAMRVPDHGKLAPWRFILFEGRARAAFGEHLASIFRAAHPEAIEELVEAERRRFTRAPVVVGVVSAALPGIKIPEWEQVLSAGAVCMSMLLAAHAQGFTGSWLTEWYSYDDQVREVLKLASHERMAGFVYLGQPAVTLEDRPRPDVDAKLTLWTD